MRFHGYYENHLILNDEYLKRGGVGIDFDFQIIRFPTVTEPFCAQLGNYFLAPILALHCTLHNQAPKP